MVIAAVAAAGLMGAGLVGVSQFASADRPELTPMASDDTLPAPSDAEQQEDGQQGDDHDGGAHEPSVDGQIVIDSGDGEPLVIDLGEGSINGESMAQFSECLGLPFFSGEPGESPFGDFEEFEGMFEDFPFDEFDGILEEFSIEDFEGMFEQFGGLSGPGHFGQLAPDGAHVTVMGPDGLTVIELGDGDGSITITQQGGEVTIETDGSATVSELDEILGAIEFGDLESFDLESFDMESFDIEEMFENFSFDMEGMFEDFDPGEFEIPVDIQDCLDSIANG